MSSPSRCKVVTAAVTRRSGAIQQEFSLNGKLWRQLYNAERQVRCLMPGGDELQATRVHACSTRWPPCCTSVILPHKNLILAMVQVQLLLYLTRAPSLKAPYFYNVETAEAQWNDPRKGDGTEKTWLASLVLFAPFIVVFLMGAAYLLYIKVLALGRAATWRRVLSQIHHPDFLQPPKKAKGGMRKARGK
eukprot:353222-Chlamydomonas_euryale.AAC.10